jgi:nucleotide-binding universal stress UspA family protein
MYKKMLVLLDGSKLAETVFNYAQELAGRLNLCLELLQVVDPRDADQLPMRQAYIESMAEVLQNKADQIRSQSGGNIKCEPARGKVVVGYPAEEILKYVDENKVDLLMLSTHGKSGIKKTWNIGSVASQVIHAARIPIWIVPSELNEAVINDKIPRRTIVIPLDGNKIPEGVIPYALSIAKQRGAESEIVLIYVDQASVALNPSGMQDAKERKEDIRKYLDDIAKSIQDSGISARSEILRGEPANEIVEYMKDNPPQLIAMAAPRTGLSKMVYGSVTENILQMIKKTPLLLIPKE